MRKMLSFVLTSVFTLFAIASVAVDGTGPLKLEGSQNMIGDTNTLSILTGSAGQVEVASGVVEVVGKLLLDGVRQVDGTYGSGDSAATFKNDTFFAGIIIRCAEVKPSCLNKQRLFNRLCKASTTIVEPLLAGS